MVFRKPRGKKGKKWAMSERGGVRGGLPQFIHFDQNLPGPQILLEMDYAHRQIDQKISYLSAYLP